tara:strand:+ start:192 stop:629 length:438 start_codon:yes stop_codon:yes gene_type:complete
VSSGQMRGKQIVEDFEAWWESLSRDDIRQLCRGACLNRSEIAKQVGFPRSSFGSNPSLRKSLERKECKLRELKTLPPLLNMEAGTAGGAVKYDQNASRNARDSRRLSELEAENIALRAQLNELKSALARYSELSDVLLETGFIPR